MQNVNLIVMSPLKAVRRPNEKVLLTRKFVDGMALYRELWKGPTTLLCEPSEIESDNLDNIEISIEHGPFKTICKPFSDSGLSKLLSGPSVVMTGGGKVLSFVNAVCRRANVPCVYVTEYSLKTRLQIVKAERQSLLRRAVRSLRQIQQEVALRRAISLADGVQCNGTPTYSAYKSLTPRPLLFFDTRANEDMLTTPERISARSANLMERPIHLVFSGRLKLMKGVNHLPLVADHLRKLGIRFKMSICGDGECLPQLQQDVRKFDLEDCVTFRGTLDFKTELLPFVADEADLFVCCHAQGDPSCTYLETMACGVPIIGYENEAFAGLVEVSGVGWLTPVNDPKALAAKIASLKPRDLTIAANQSLSFARDHTFEKTFQRRIDHLDMVASARPH